MMMYSRLLPNAKRMAILMVLSALSACAPQTETSWGVSSPSVGKVGVMGPSGSIGP